MDTLILKSLKSSPFPNERWKAIGAISFLKLKLKGRAKLVRFAIDHSLVKFV